MQGRSVSLSICVFTAIAGTARSQVVLYEFGGSTAAQLGYAVAAAGDFNNDGVNDFLVGAPFGTGLQVVAGFVKAYSGKTGQGIRTFQGEKISDQFGWSVACIDDLNGDGVGDVLIGAPGYDGGGLDRGAAYVLSGANGAVIKKHVGSEDGAKLGHAVSCLSDVNSDGFKEYAYSELLLDGATLADTGAVRIVSGASFQTLRSFFGEATSDLFGSAIASGGRLKSGVNHSILIGAPGFDTSGGLVDAGKGYVYDASDGSLEYTRVGSGLSSALGTAVANISDYTGDSWNEFAFSEPYPVSYFGVPSGHVSVYSGANGALVRDFSGLPGDQFGAAIAGMEDADGDGRVDILIGAPGANPAGFPLGGAVYSYSIFTGALINTFEPLLAAQAIGSSVAALKLNADAYTDVIAGAPFYSGVAPGSGWVRVALGNTSEPVLYCAGKVNSAGCLPVVTYSGALSLSVGNNFTVQATNVLPNKAGMLIWSPNQGSVPFNGATLCIALPIARTPLQFPGTNFTSACIGTYTYTFAQSNLTQFGMQPGDDVHAQFWSRDTGFAPPQDFGLTSAVKAEILP